MLVRSDFPDVFINLFLPASGSFKYASHRLALIAVCGLLIVVVSFCRVLTLGFKGLQQLQSSALVVVTVGEIFQDQG